MLKQYLLSYIDDQRRSLPQTEIDEAISKSGKLQYKSYQLFAQKFMSPHTDVRRLYIKYGTGVGKTSTALSITMPFIELFQKEQKVTGAQVGSIIVLGFTKQIFKRELLKYPEFKYITRDELVTLRELHNTIISKTDETKYVDYLNYIRRRITNRKYRGFFQFYGYREFVNRIFLSDKQDLFSLSEAELKQKIDSGSLELNTELLDTFKNSVVICDEIHNVYNSCDKNNWGVALQTLLNYHGDNIRAIFLSATPINHHPSEIVDLLNLLHINKTFKRSDFFNEISTCYVNNQAEELIADKPVNTALKPGALEEIGKLFSGKLLFLEDANPRYFPASMISGEHIKGVPILKFIRCPMSKYHYKTYESIYNGTIPQDGQYIQDIAFPNPNDVIGLYRTNETKSILQNANPAWLEKTGIRIVNDCLMWNITGSFLGPGRLQEYSNKYYTMITNIISLIKSNSGKIMIYHKYVKMSGVLLIAEILKQYGILDEISEPNDNTLDVYTGIPRSLYIQKHKNKMFHPARFAIVHSDIDISLRDASIERFNQPRNADGSDLLILLGADMIKESHDIKCIRHLFVMYKPDNISSLIQIFGRGKRQNSHIDLPPSQRTITYYIYTHCLPDKSLSHEEVKYADRIRDYELIQKIERSMHKNAVDSLVNYNIIKNTFVKDGELGVLAYKYFNENVSVNNKDISYNYYYTQEEIKFCAYIIKRLFLEVSPIYKLDTLIQHVKNPPFPLEYNSALFDDDSIKVALYKLLYKENTSLIHDNKINRIDRLFSDSDRIISWNNTNYVISTMKDSFILVEYNGSIECYADSIYRKRAQDNDIIININSYFKYEDPINTFDKKREEFIKKYYNNGRIELGKIINAICDYNNLFQKLMIEYSIQYVVDRAFNKVKKLPEEEFILTLITLYDTLGLIVYHNMSKLYIQEQYPLIKSTPVNPITKTLENYISLKPDVNIGPLDDVNVHNNKTKVSIMTKLLANPVKSPTDIIECEYIPIGHLFENTPRFYHYDRGWFDASDYIIDNKVWKENDIIIGYQHREEGTLLPKFKIRPPKHLQKIDKDARRIERGSLCITQPKPKLIELCKKLDIKIDSSTKDICILIRHRLIYLELLERRKNSDIKYFYHYWENNDLLSDIFE